MMTLVTSKGKTYPALWTYGPTKSGRALMEIRDVRALSEIAAEFEGLEWLERKSEEQGNLRMEGYTKLIQIKLTSNGTIEIVLDKP